MKFVLKSILLIIPFLSIGQVGVNTVNPKADLDITATAPVSPTSETGILLPRISNFPTTNPTIEQNSMLVYLNTAVNRDITGTGVKDYPVGFYYWHFLSTDWIKLEVSGNSNGWLTQGNDDTVSGTNFIGTTNAQDLDFRT
ncbi:MAG: NosD domain-containing protein, partial [Nonlabens sp.]